MRPLVLAFLLILVFVGSATAQDTHGRLQGRIVDSDGRPIATVDVSVRSPDLQGERHAETNVDGFFTFRWLPVGTYSVRLQRLAYETRMLDSVTVRLGRTTTVGEVGLVEAPIEVEALAATAQRLLIDPESTAGGINLTPSLYENLPVSRNYRDLATLIPQSNESFLGDGLNIAGSTGGEIRYFIDGSDVTDPLNGFDAISLPYNFIRELEVKTGGYEAEYRSSLGGLVSAVTHSGGERFVVSAFGFYSSNRFEGSPRLGPSDLARTSAAVYDVGATAGGPILRERLWYFAAYNPSVVQETIEIPGNGVFDDRSVRHRFAAKVTWKAASRTQLYLSAFGDPGQRDAVAPTSISTASFTPLTPDPWLTRRESGGVSVLLAGSQAFSSGLLEASVSYLNHRNTLQPATPAGAAGPQFHDFVNETVSGGIVRREDYSSGRAAARLKATWELGAHTLKAGGEYAVNRSSTNEWSHHVIKHKGPGRYLKVDIEESGSFQNRVPGLFVQDSWRASPRLRLNAGLRWEGQFLIGSDEKVHQKVLDQWQPRLGFVALLGRPGSQRLYGSYGRYYQDLAVSIELFPEVVDRVS